MSAKNTHDKAGRPWAKLSEIKAGELIELDSGFTCARAGQIQVYARASGELFFYCEDGTHLLLGQADDGEHLVGIYKIP